MITTTTAPAGLPLSAFFTRHAGTSSAPRFATARRAVNGAVSHKSRTPLTLDDVARIIPSVTAQDKHASRSDQYTYIPTLDILRGLYSEGWQAFALAQGGSRDEGKRDFTKHQIRLRHQSTGELVKGEIISEVILTNSHDGTSAYHLRAGAFRVQCANGLVTPAGLISDVRVPHKGDVAGLVIDGCCELIRDLPAITDNIQSLKAVNLSQGEQQALATAALALRYDGDTAAPITPGTILTPRRIEDNRPDLWTTFNRVQEHLITGGNRYTQRDEAGRMVARRETRPVKGIDQNTNLNRALWTLAEEMRKLKASA
jgi:hypothetical protein